MEETVTQPAESAADAALFVQEAARLRASGVLGESGRLAELFDFLSARGPFAPSASQAEIAEAVLGQASSASDDATVRVYVHRLRKRLAEFYAGEGGSEALGRLELPAGTYALRLLPGEVQAEAAPAKRLPRWALLAAPLLLLAAFAAGWLLRPGPADVSTNAIWQPFIASKRPILVVLGDYYIFGEIDPFSANSGRLIRDFEINSPTDLARAQEADPERYGKAEDMGLNYLPFSSAYGLRELMPILARGGRQVTVIPASQLTSDAFQDHNVVYIGLVSGMGLLEDVNFMNSKFAVGGNYDELVDTVNDRRYVSQEAINLPSTRYYKDFGYLSVFHEPGGALVAVVAGERDTGLRGLAPLVAARRLPRALDEAAKSGGQYEALYQITGQQGADLDEKLLVVRRRP